MSAVARTLLRAFAVLCVVGVACSCCAATSDRNCHTHPWPYANNTLSLGESLTVGQHIAVKNAYLILERSGSLVVYRGSFPSTQHKWWTSSTDGSNAERLTLTPHGDLQLLNTSGGVVWRAGTSNSTIAVLQDNCLLALYNKAPLTNQTWNTGTVMCINAHIVPHSHDDVGWLLTPERYYDGCHDPTGGVQSIIGTMIEALAANASRTFVQVESYFFNRWWQLQSDATKATAKRVVDNQQFVFINGGWSMHDEACVHQESAIANMAVGAQFLKQEFNANLTIGWHIDPFGHASTTPRIMAQMGFNGFFFWRTDYEQRNYMMQTQTLETMWKPSPSLGDQVNMFTSILYEDYCIGCRVDGQGGFPMCPSSFCCYYCEQDKLPNWAHYFEKIHAKEREQTHVHHLARMFGVQEIPANKLRVNDLAKLYAQNIQQYAANFRTNNVLMPWGCDFEHINAHTSFSLMDDIIAAINSDPSLGVQAFYSTPQTYLDAVQSLNYSWPTNEFDYFLDSDNGHAYWSGYFSSRAEYKRFERWLMNQRSSVEIALSSQQRTDLQQQNARVLVLQEALGVAQHHDSITGTEREHVRDRYQLLLTEGLVNASAVFADVFETTTGVRTVPCFLSNLSSCDATDSLNRSEAVSVYLYNPLMWTRNEIIVVPVPTTHIGVLLNDSGVLTPITSQVQPTWALTTSDDPTAPAYQVQPFEVVFSVTLPPHGLVEVVLTPSPSPDNQATVVSPTSGVSVLSNDAYSVAFDAASGTLAGILNQNSGVYSNLSQNIMFYTPMGPGNGQAAGAYIFRPNTPNAVPTAFAEVFVTHSLTGPVCSEVRQNISEHHSIYQSIRVCRGQPYVDMTSGIGPVDPGWSGLEVILRLQSDIDSNSTWYTDSEGLELQQRLRNRHVNYPHVVTEPVASNYYPCNLFSVINSSTSNKSLSVVADYSRATASLSDGELEFLMIRRLLFDDNRGVAQPLNENIRVLSSSRLIMNEPESITVTRRHSVLHAHPPVVRFGGRSTKSWTNSAVSLPDNVLLHTRQQLGNGVFLVRLQHTHAAGEGSLAANVTVDLASVMPAGFTLSHVTETDLNGVMTLRQANEQRMQFATCDAATGVSRNGPAKILSSIVSGSTVVLFPMDLRTYLVSGTW